MAFSPARSATSHAPRSKPSPDQPLVFGGPRGSRYRYTAAKMAEVRHLVETTLMTYAEIAQRTGVARGTIWQWSSHGRWMRPGFAPRDTHTVPAWRAGRQRRRRMLAVRLVALAERYVRALAAVRPVADPKPRARVIADPEHDPEKWVPVFGKRSCSNGNANGIGIVGTPGKTVARKDRRDHRSAPDRNVDGMIEDVRQDGRPRPPHPAAIRREDVPLSPRK
jgi:hypothetical protein